MIIAAVLERTLRSDGKLNVTFETDGVPMRTHGAPDLPDLELISWMEAEIVRFEAEKALLDAKKIEAIARAMTE